MGVTSVEDCFNYVRCCFCVLYPRWFMLYSRNSPFVFMQYDGALDITVTFEVCDEKRVLQDETNC